MTNTLDDDIRQLVTELMESAPQAPMLSELEWEETLRQGPSGKHRGESRARRRPLVTLSAVAAVVAVILVLVLQTPSVVQHPPVAAAAALRSIAKQVASEQPAPLPGDGQWLLSEEHVVFIATVNQLGGKQIQNAQATIPTTVKVWSNNLGQSCVVASSRSAQFASTENRSAWVAAGLLVTPSGPSSLCTEGSVDQPIGGAGVIDASGLPTDPAQLANELENGSTGIVALDGQTASENPGFNRAASLLFGSTVGLTPALRSALFQAIALMPGVTALGNVKTNTGDTGAGFSVGTSPKKSTIIVDPKSGTLLEAENIQDPNIFTGLGTTFLAPPPTPSIETEGGSYDVTIVRLNPIGEPTISPVPADLEPAPPFGSSGTITATTKVGVTWEQIEALQPQLQEYGKALNNSSTSPTTNTLVYVFSFNGGEAQVNGYAKVLNASGLFSSVMVQPAT